MMFPEAPFFHDIARGAVTPRTIWVQTEDNIRLRVGVWTHLHAKGSVLIFSPRARFVEYFTPLATHLVQAGYSVICVDWRGQGLSQRSVPDPRIGHVDDFAEYQHDVQAMLSAARAHNLPEPYYMVAGSMGGMIGLRSLMNGLSIRAAAFFAPMWGLQLSLTVRIAGRILGSVARRIGTSNRMIAGQSYLPYVVRAPFEGNGTTTDRSEYEAHRDDILAHPELGTGSPSYGWLQAALVEMKTVSQMPSPKVPTVTVMGSEETTVGRTATRKRMQHWPGGRLVEIPNARHDLLLEAPSVRDRFYAEVTALLNSEV